MQFREGLTYKTTMPIMVMMCGLAGSGKSTFAKEVTFRNKKPIIHSSDALREELYGDASVQGDNNKLFAELHKRIKRDLSQGNDVIYDATNINKKKRIAFLKELDNIFCYKICVVLATEYETCLLNNSNRERKVPEEVIRKMLLNYQPPHENEGFDAVAYVYSLDSISQKKNTLKHFFNIANNFDQHNSHHSLTLGEHCKKVGEQIMAQCPEKKLLYFAGLLHDIGKLETQTKVNCRGEYDGNYHYYNHNCVGAYLSMFYLHEIEGFEKDGFDLTYVPNVIYYHMNPYLAWVQSNKARERDRKLLGNEMFEDIMILHEADKKAK